MTVTSERSPDGRQVTLLVEGRFDFASHQAFRAAYQNHPADLDYVVDLRGTHYLDSSALGMLLLLRDQAFGRLLLLLPIDGGDGLLAQLLPGAVVRGGLGHRAEGFLIAAGMRLGHLFDEGQWILAEQRHCFATALKGEFNLSGWVGLAVALTVGRILKNPGDPFA